MLITLENVGKSWGIDVILQKINAVVNEGDTTSKEVVDSIVYIPKTIDILTPLVSVVPLQLIS